MTSIINSFEQARIKDQMICSEIFGSIKKILEDGLKLKLKNSVIEDLKSAKRVF